MAETLPPRDRPSGATRKADAGGVSLEGRDVSEDPRGLLQAAARRVQVQVRLRETQGGKNGSITQLREAECEAGGVAL